MGLSLSRQPPFLRKFSIKLRLITAFVITSLLPVLVVAIYSNVRYEAAISDKLSAFSQQVLSESAVNASRELAQYETLSEFIIINDLIQHGLQTADSRTDIENNKLQTDIGEVLAEQVFRLSNLSNVVVLTNERKTFFDLGYEWYPDNRLTQSLEDLEGAPGNMNWTFLRSNRGSDKIALSRVIFSADNLNDRLGFLIIVIDEKVFSRNTYEHVDLGKGGRLYIADQDGAVVSSVSEDIPHGKPFEPDKVFARFAASTAAPSFYTHIDGKKTLVTGTYIRSANWFMIGLIPHAYVVSEMSALRFSLLISCLLIVLLSAFLALWIYRSISSPMRELLQYATQVKIGQLDTPMTVPYPDEMGKLTETIDQMVARLKQLIYQVETEQKAKRDAELNMLQAQINPHFLFNTLNSLKWSSMMSGNHVVEQGLASLSELLHNTILDQEEMIPLAKEIDNLLHYAVIQRIRYGESFKLVCRVDDGELYDCLVPRFILQPIVENSIIHAGGGEGRIVTITLEVSRMEETLTIRLADNGKGFDTTGIRQRKHSHDKLSGIGMDNVAERLRLHVGSQYGMETRSEPERGTETIIRLPVRRKEGLHDV